MAKSEKSAKTKAGLSAHVVHTLREGALWVFGAVALLLWYALFSYDASDPGFSQVSATGAVHNGVGKFGANIADILFMFFGRPAYLFTVMVFYFGWMIYREQATKVELTRADFVLRFSGFLATLITSCALSALHFSPIGFPETAGGIVGEAVGDEIGRAHV